MKRLAMHYERVRYMQPENKLMILFDIDGTILDMRCMILHVLQAFDHYHETCFFEGMKSTDITIHETEVNKLLDKLAIPMDQSADIVAWYEKNFWSNEAMLEAHRPFAGVMEVIRWFQMQPNTLA